jgi:hypothetical protein
MNYLSEVEDRSGVIDIPVTGNTGIIFLRLRYLWKDEKEQFWVIKLIETCK